MPRSLKLNHSPMPMKTQRKRSHWSLHTYTHTHTHTHTHTQTHTTHKHAHTKQPEQSCKPNLASEFESMTACLWVSVWESSCVGRDQWLLFRQTILHAEGRSHDPHSHKTEQSCKRVGCVRSLKLNHSLDAHEDSEKE